MKPKFKAGDVIIYTNTGIEYVVESLGKYKGSGSIYYNLKELNKEKRLPVMHHKVIDKVSVLHKLSKTKLWEVLK